MWIAGCAYGQLGEVKVEGVTSTRAVLRYTAPATVGCSVEVSESESYSPLVNDVNNSIFAGSQQDGRFTALHEGSTRIFVVGARTSETGADGKLYSRALRQNQKHHFRITCGAETATGVFTTAIIPWGAMNPENPPFNKDGFGNYGWPTIDWNDKLKWYIDPMTGLAYKPAVYPGEFANRYPVSGAFLFGSELVVDPGGAWTGATQVRSGGTSQVATTTAANQPIYAGIDPTVTQPYFQNLTGIDYKAVSIDDIGVKVYGSGTDGTAANREIQMCWSLDWATCYTDSVTVTLPSGGNASVGVFPASYPKAFFHGWGKGISRLHLGRTGPVDVVDTAVTLTSYAGTDSAFHYWAPGTRIWISGSSPICPSNLCTVAEVTGPKTLTLVESLTLTGSTYKYGPALRIVKTIGTGTVRVSVSHETAISNVGGIPPSGSFEVCSTVVVSTSVDRDGNPSATKQGRTCAFDTAQSQGGGIYWVGDDGETRLLSVFRPPTTVANSSNPADAPEPNSPYLFMVGFDPEIGTRWYAQAKCAGVSNARARCIFQLDYTGDFREWRPSPLYPVGAGIQPGTPSDSVVWSILTKPSTGKDVQSQIDLSFPGYDKAKWGDLKNGIDGAGVAGRYMMIAKQGYGAGESPVCFAFVFDLTNGEFVRGWDNYSGQLSQYMRWSACHASLAVGGPKANYFFQSFNLNRQIWGAYTTAVTHLKRNGEYSTNTALPAAYNGTYDGACPANGFGASGNSCVFVKVAGEPCKVANLTNEKTFFPCPTDPAKAGLTNIAVGDVIYDNVVPDNSERLQVIEKTVISPTEIALTLKRDAIPSSVDPRCVGTRLHSNGWVAAMNFGGTRSCVVSSLIIDPVSGAVHSSQLLDHFDLGVGIRGDFRWVSASQAYSEGGVEQLSTKLPDISIAVNPSFAGAPAAGIPPTQSYPSGRQWTADRSEKGWTLNHRHYTQWGYQTITKISGNLYLLQTLGTPDTKRTPFAVTAGPHLLSDISSPKLGDTIQPSNTWKYCYAYRAGECRSGSQAGQMYVVTPAPLTENLICDEGNLTVVAPCAYVPTPVGGWGIQEMSSRNNANGRWVRRLSMQPGPQRHPSFENWRPLPDGKMAIWRSSWTDGLYSTLMLAQLPPNQEDSINRTTFIPMKIEIGAGAITNRAMVRFWYDEHSGYCASRAEDCFATAATLTVSNPFLYRHEVTATSGQSCASGCTLTVPTLSGRVVYFEVVDNQGGAIKPVAGTKSLKAVP
jgi:hypothetical protein